MDVTSYSAARDPSMNEKVGVGWCGGTDSRVSIAGKGGMVAAVISP